MAIKALSISDTFEYVSDSDPAKVRKQVPVDADDPSKGTKEEIEIKDGATVFGLKPLDVFLMGYIYDNASSLTGRQGSEEVGIHTRVNQTNLEAVKYGLAYFKNFKDANDNDVSVNFVDSFINSRKYKSASDDTLKLLGNRLIGELAQQIKDKSEVDQVEAKN